MSTPKTIRSYPKMYMEIVKRIAKNPASRVELPFDEQQQAKTFRLRFNSFKTLAVKGGLADAEDLYVQVKELPPRVIIQHKDYTDEALGIEKALKVVSFGV